MATRQELLAQLLAGQPNVSTGAGRARPFAAPAVRQAPTAASVDRNRLRAEILAQEVPLPRTQPGMAAPVQATQMAALANIAKAVLRNRQRKKNDAQSRELLDKELEMARGGDPFADPLQPIVPPSLQGVRPMDAPEPPRPRGTVLSPDEEKLYRTWMERIGHTADRGFAVDADGTGENYDYRGFFKKNGPVELGEDEHLTDEFKLPSHPTFSDESVYAKGDAAGLAGRWEGETYVPSTSRQIRDRARQTAQDARRAQQEGLLPFLEASEATAQAEKPFRDQHDMAALRSGGPESIFAAERLLPKPPPEPFTLGQDEVRFAGDGTELARGPASPEELGEEWETFYDDAGNMLQRSLVTGEVKRVIEAEKPVNDDTDDVREYKFAQAGGYEGSFEDWQVLMGRSRAPRVAQNVPAGYEAEYDAEGNIIKLTPIPGGPAALEHEQAARDAAQKDAQAQREAEEAERKRQAAESQAAAMRAGEVQSADVVTQEIDRALERMASGGLSGVGGLSFVKDIPIIGSSTDAKAVEGFFDTIKANIGFDELQAMREASPTGGALGQVTELELRMLQAAAGTLDQSQDDDELRYNLNRLWNQYMDVIHGPGNGPPRRALDFSPGAASRLPTSNAPAQPQVAPEVANRVRSYYDAPQQGRRSPQQMYSGPRTGRLEQ